LAVASARRHGGLLPGVLFLICERLFGRRRAIVIALLVLSSPTHIFQSELSRFYSPATLFAGAALLLGAMAARTGATAWTASACVAALLAALTHTVCLVLLSGLAFGIVLDTRIRTGSSPKNQIWILTATGVIGCAIYGFYLRPLLVGWNAGASWGYSVGHATLASANLFEWPVTLLAGLGLLIAIERRDEGRWYWLTEAGTWLAVTLILPGASIHHPSYMFPLSLAGLVLEALPPARSTRTSLRPHAWPPSSCWLWPSGSTCLVC
jgi:hypothetical protein